MKTNEDQTGKKYLSEMIEFERDIAPHPITLILGGVGCGKTSFIKNLADGTIPGAEDLRFCFVTNRKNRVNQTVFDVYDDDRNINLFIDKLYYRGNLYEPGMGQMITNTGYEYIPDETLKNRRTSRYIGDIFNQNACVTNAKFGFFLYKIYKTFGKQSTDAVYDILLELFDVFVFDEIHAVNTDSGYQEAPFYIWKFIETFNKKNNNSKKHIILMTGTIDPIRSIINKIKGLHTIDARKTCVHVVPDHVEFITTKKSLAEIGWFTTIDVKNILYFYSGKIRDVDYFCKNNGANKEVMMTYYSEYNPRWQIVGETEEEIMKYADEHLKISQFRCALVDQDKNKRGRFPEGIHFVASTSCLMEGVDLYDVDIVYICAHNMTEAVQMAGRVRNGGHVVKIIVDSQEFMGYDDFIEEEAVNKKEKQLLPQLNKEFKKLSFEDKLKHIEKTAKKQYKYIMFDYVNDEYQFYSNKLMSINYYKAAFLKWHRLNDRGLHRGDMSLDYYRNIVREWFPGTEVYQYHSSGYEAREMIRTTLKNHRIKINTSVYNKLLKELCKLYGENHHMSWFLTKTGIKGRFKRVDGKKSYYVFEKITE